MAPPFTCWAGKAGGSVRRRVAARLAGAAGSGARDVGVPTRGARLAGRAAGGKGVSAQGANSALQGARISGAAGVAAREAEESVLGGGPASGGGRKGSGQDVDYLIHRHLQGVKEVVRAGCRACHAAWAIGRAGWVPA